MNLKEEAENVFRETLEKVNPEKFLPDIVKFNKKRNSFSVYDTFFDHDKGAPLYIIGTGKAAHTMAAAMEELFGDSITGGLIIIPPGTGTNLRIINTAEGSHPVPDEKSFSASKKFLRFIDEIPAGATVFNLLSGGTSSLFSYPANGISPAHFSDLFKLLVESGASIQEINSVRKTVSEVKGGQLLERLSNTTLLDLIISDIPDDDLRYVGSGPTAPQEISVPEAIEILEEYNLWIALPSELQDYFNKKNRSEPHRTTKDFEGHHQWIVSSAATVAKHTGKILNSRGYKTNVSKTAWEGPIDEFKTHILNKFHQEREENSEKKRALVFYGECTVKVTGNGLGGRNQELVLRMANELSGYDSPVVFLSCGTDGIDGPTDAAGAVADQSTVQEAEKIGLSADDFIERNDSYHFFEKAGGHIITGPTGNNVMDIQILLMD